MGVSAAPHPSQHLVFLVFWTRAIGTGVWKNLVVSFNRWETFSVTSSSDRSLSGYPSLLILGPLWGKYLYVWCCHRGTLNYLHFLNYFFSFRCSGWLSSTTLSFRLLILLSITSHLLSIPSSIYIFYFSYCILQFWLVLGFLSLLNFLTSYCVHPFLSWVQYLYDSYFEVFI